jgi:hypothetical protein
MAMLSVLTNAYRTERATTHTKPRRTPLLVHIGRAAARLLPRWRQLRTIVLSLAGFGLISAAAWTVALPLGLLAAGISVLVIEYLTTGDGT